MTVRLLAATDSNFVGLVAGRAPDGLRLPAGGLEAPEIVEMLRALAQSFRMRIDPAAWMIVDQDEVVGLCSITKPFSSPGLVEIGYGVGPEHRGRGFATAALRALLTLLHEDQRILAVAAETAVDNLASQRVLEKNGFLRIGGRVDAEDGAVFCWQFAVR